MKTVLNVIPVLCLLLTCCCVSKTTASKDLDNDPNPLNTDFISKSLSGLSPQEKKITEDITMLWEHRIASRGDSPMMLTEQKIGSLSEYEWFLPDYFVLDVEKLAADPREEMITQCFYRPDDWVPFIGRNLSRQYVDIQVVNDGNGWRESVMGAEFAERLFWLEAEMEKAGADSWSVVYIWGREYYFLTVDGNLVFYSPTGIKIGADELLEYVMFKHNNIQEAGGDIEKLIIM